MLPAYFYRLSCLCGFDHCKADFHSFYRVEISGTAGLLFIKCIHKVVYFQFERMMGHITAVSKIVGIFKIIGLSGIFVGIKLIVK